MLSLVGSEMCIRDRRERGASGLDNGSSGTPRDCTSRENCVEKCLPSASAQN
jgi:hypothetical protein